MSIYKLMNVVIELSARLADESDYDENLVPKLQALLDYLEENKNGRTIELA